MFQTPKIGGLSSESFYELVLSSEKYQDNVASFFQNLEPPWIFRPVWVWLDLSIDDIRVAIVSIRMCGERILKCFESPEKILILSFMKLKKCVCHNLPNGSETDYGYSSPLHTLKFV